jgi:hypothetical protein
LPLMFSRHASAIDAIIEDAYAIIDADYWHAFRHY